MAPKTTRHRPRTVKGPRRASWRAARPARRGARRGLPLERRRQPRLTEVETAQTEPRLAREAEAIEEEEDDFSDGRSSAGRTLRDEEDLWGRGLAPEERPFEESDVPPRPPEPPELR